MNSTPLARFTELYEARPDPWNTTTSWYEQRKRNMAMACLPRPTYSVALEPACGTGELTSALASRCGSVLASDGLDTVVEYARRRLRPHPRVSVSRRRLPEEFPADPASADLVVLSEILYYFDGSDLDAVLESSWRALRPGGDLLAVHWRPRAHDAPTCGESVHHHLRARRGCEWLVSLQDPDFLVDVLRLR
ncbi:SAM-dependent methyltransferase [Saccharopolyspora lacisalsi]|uniref:SAM-dependent methyltransferase n=1 Tax=Halosaccharopolyspora lacisalsi TaxID=1000566 RepID=A0A839DVL7_9PSEU|nr:class I SAM-dependent methyltransferase [Halosaccharopolyspora lacisalsi]MBA8824950.1 SAM-dependent methyltransferase [Halosaccharopolyspora lacisalsi]